MKRKGNAVVAGHDCYCTYKHTFENRTVRPRDIDYTMFGARRFKTTLFKLFKL